MSGTARQNGRHGAGFPTKTDELANLHAIFLKKIKVLPHSIQ
jgi:hypothetical protein